MMLAHCFAAALIESPTAIALNIADAPPAIQTLANFMALRQSSTRRLVIESVIFIFSACWLCRCHFQDW